MERNTGEFVSWRACGNNIFTAGVAASRHDLYLALVPNVRRESLTHTLNVTTNVAGDNEMLLKV